MIKKIFSCFLAVLMLVSFVACAGGGDSKDTTKAPVQTTAPVTEPPAPAPYVPTAADFSIVYASDASKEIKEKAKGVFF